MNKIGVSWMENCGWRIESNYFGTNNLCSSEFFSGLLPSLSIDAQFTLPSRNELWDEAIEELEGNKSISDATPCWTFYSDRSKIEKKVIDLFLNKLKELIKKQSLCISEQKAERILNKLISKFEYQVIDYLGIIQERYYLHYKINSDYSSFYVGGVIDTEYEKTEQLLSNSFSLFKEENYRIPINQFPERSVKAFIFENEEESKLYHKSDGAYIDSGLFNECSESIKKFTKKFFSWFNILTLRILPREKRRYFVQLFKDIYFIGAISSFMYHKASLSV